jgi:hypothetical protein
MNIHGDDALMGEYHLVADGFEDCNNSFAID